MVSRRHFLRQSTLVALSPLVPAFLDQMARAAGAQKDARILVVVQLEGGNDGINTVVPFGDEAYAKHRRELRIKTEDVLKIDDHVGLHPAMRGMSKLLEQGRLSIVQGVGYPNPNRSHFESMRIWQTARLAPAESERGWIGGAFDQLPLPRPGGPDAVYVGDSELPRALVGRRTDAAAISSAEDLALHLAEPGAPARPPEQSADVAAFVQRSILNAYGTARQLAGTGAGSGNAVDAYPQSKLGRQLQLVSRFIKSGASTRVYYASQSGYDTHYAQLPQHEDLLRELSNAIKAFMDDLKASGLSERVLLMSFSEFGRRVAENGSLGTDHGTSAPVFIAGDVVKAGLVGKTPSLSDLQSGDLKMSVDFRQVYATLLQDWLDVPVKDALAGEFATLPILRGA